MENITLLRFADSLGHLGVKISRTLHFGEKHGYYLSSPIRIKTRNQTQKYFSHRKQQNLFDRKVRKALDDNKNRFFAKFQMKKH
jgi:hypothetical protein